MNFRVSLLSPFVILLEAIPVSVAQIRNDEFSVDHIVSVGLPFRASCAVFGRERADVVEGFQQGGIHPLSVGLNHDVDNAVDISHGEWDMTLLFYELVDLVS